MTPEAKVKKVVVKQLKDMGAYYFYPITGGYGRSGGNFFGLECKAGSNKPSPLQQKNLDDIAGQGGIALVVNEQNMKDVGKLLSSVAQRDPSGEKKTDGLFLQF